MPVMLSSDLPLRAALRQVLDMGAACVPHALQYPTCERLQREVEHGSFVALDEQVGPYGVRQEAALLSIDDLDSRAQSYPIVLQLRDSLLQRLREQGGDIAGLPQWLPTRVSVQRYPAGVLGITPHRDGKRHPYLVAIFTIHGSAPFRLCRDRAGELVQEWQASPGSLVLLRGPGLGGVADGRPFHTVRGPQAGVRFSVTFRM